jgi:hypothetical protein
MGPGVAEQAECCNQNDWRHRTHPNITRTARTVPIPRCTINYLPCWTWAWLQRATIAATSQSRWPGASTPCQTDTGASRWQRQPLAPRHKASQTRVLPLLIPHFAFVHSRAEGLALQTWLNEPEVQVSYERGRDGLYLPTASVLLPWLQPQNF